MATMAGDAEAVAELRQEIATFNQKQPARRITAVNLRNSVRARQRRIAEAEQGVYLPKNRRDVMDVGRFAVAD